MNKIQYEYVYEGESYPDEAVVFLSDWSPVHTTRVARDAAKDSYNVDSDPNEFPLKLEIFHEGKRLGLFSIEIEFEPTFWADEIDK